MEDKIYLYNKYYYSFDEIKDMYKKVAYEKRKAFKDTLAHYTLLEILDKCNYDKRIRELIESLADEEAAIIGMYGADCGTPALAIKGMHSKNLRKLINLTGKPASRDDSRENLFANGEWLLNNLVCLTIGSSFEKTVDGDLSLIDYTSLTEEECRAIANNFVRNMRGEEIVFYKSHTYTKK